MESWKEQKMQIKAPAQWKAVGVILGVSSRHKSGVSFRIF